MRNGVQDVHLEPSLFGMFVFRSPEWVHPALFFSWKGLRAYKVPVLRLFFFVKEVLRYEMYNQLFKLFIGLNR